MSDEFDVKSLCFSFDLKKANYEIDELQNRLLQFYIRADNRFRRAFSMNYTNDFLAFIKSKARLREPIHLSVMGNTRSGKSYSAITICIYHQACYGRKFSINYICANAMEFLEKLKSLPENELKDRIFLIDEEKTAVMGYGSYAKKLKLQDVANIIAINNISTISLNPIKWANDDAFYGLRTFGRCFSTKTTRMMLYNLQEGGKGSSLPLGNIYLPIFTAFAPKDYADEIEIAYLEKKHEWVNQEMRGEADNLASLRKNIAGNFMRDDNFRLIKKKNEKIAYITYKLGSEWTTKECEDIYQLTKLFEQGFIS